MWTGWWKRWLFTDAGTIVRAGRVRPLVPSDAPPLAPALEPTRASPAFDQLSLQRFWPFILQLFFTTGRPAKAIVTLTFVRIAVAVSAPLLLRNVLEALPAARAAVAFPWALLALAVLLGLSGMLSALITQHWYHLALQIRTIGVNALNRRVVGHALRLRRSARAQMQTGDLVNHLGSDTDALAECGFFLPEAFNALLTMAAAFAVLSVYLGWAALAAAGSLVLLTPFTAMLGARFRSLDHRIMAIRDQRTTLMSQILHGIRVVKYHAWEPSLRAEVQAVREREIGTRIGLVSTDVFATAIWVSTATVVAFAGFGAFVLLGGQLTASLVFPCLALFAMLEEPFGLISHILARMQHAQVATSRLHGYFDAPTRPHDERALSPAQQAIALRGAGLCVEYDGMPARALADANLEIPAGSAVAIVGPVGSGKSTLLRVLAAVQLPAGGTLEHDAQGRPRIAYVPQEAFILNASVRANIAFGADGDTEATEGPLDGEAAELSAIATDCALLPDLAAMP
ncbi:MAG TPA: ABC transporter transmembrane domain-containing protein, partial [Polyangiales bacterium]|nr:ABC transporter transmembrane domain-containing protein [Polyangiales bacterium]